MEFVKYYESVSDVMKENPNIKRPTLNKAIVENRVYYNYRWLFVERRWIHQLSMKFLQRKNPYTKRWDISQKSIKKNRNIERIY